MSQPVVRRDIPLATIVASIVLCTVGLAVAIYLTVEHYNTSLVLSCPDTGRINCQKVTTSQYSSVIGIPVAVLGVVYFVAMLVLVSPPAWRSSSPRVRYARFGWLGVGLVMVVYLVGAEFLGVQAICLWCTSIHAIVLVLFVLVAFTEAWSEPAGAV